MPAGTNHAILGEAANHFVGVFGLQDHKRSRAVEGRFDPNSKFGSPTYQITREVANLVGYVLQSIPL